MIYNPKMRVFTGRPSGTPYTYRNAEMEYRRRAREAKKDGDHAERRRCTISAIRLRAQREQGGGYSCVGVGPHGRSVHCITGRCARLFWKADVYIILDADGNPCWVL